MKVLKKILLITTIIITSYISYSQSPIEFSEEWRIEGECILNDGVNFYDAAYDKDKTTILFSFYNKGVSIPLFRKYAYEGVKHIRLLQNNKMFVLPSFIRRINDKYGRSVYNFERFDIWDLSKKEIVYSKNSEYNINEDTGFINLKDGFLIINILRNRIITTKIDFKGNKLWKRQVKFDDALYGYAKNYKGITFFKILKNNNIKIQYYFNRHIESIILSDKGKLIWKSYDYNIYHETELNRSTNKRTLLKTEKGSIIWKMLYSSSAKWFVENDNSETYIAFHNNRIRKVDINGKTIWEQKFNNIPDSPLSFIEIDKYSFILKRKHLVIKYTVQNKLINKKIESDVEKSIYLWKQKGKYEKNINYSERVNESTIKQRKKETFERILKSYGNDLFKEIRVELGEYDVEKEFFKINFGKLGKGIINVPINKAEKFELNFKNNKYKKPKYKLTENGILLYSIDILSPQLNYTIKYIH